MTSIPYAQAIDSLMHNNVSTRLDYFYTINSLVQFLSNPRFSHWQTLKSTMWYIKPIWTWDLNTNIKKMAIFYTIFFNENWTDNKDTWWSTSGY
jgi:hypothetical protein